jgi:hypothetical protein
MKALRSKRRRCGLAAAVVAVTIATGVAGAGTSYAEAGSSYLSVLNHERASRGIAPLHMSADLVRVAHSWALEMARTGVLRHNPRLRSQVPNWWVVGENVGDGPDMADLARAFWHSPEHRANILNRHYSDVGISTVRADGRLWIAVVFRDPWHETAPARPQQRASRTSQRAYPGRLLLLGTSGPAVAYVQRLLGMHPSGVFGALTRRTVLTFQRHHHLVADGIVGPITWSALLRVRA